MKDIFGAPHDREMTINVCMMRTMMHIALIIKQSSF